jgi:hypothetical protein
VQEREAEVEAGPGRRERGCLGLVVRVSETGPGWRTMFLIRGTARRPQQQIARSRQLSGAKRAPQQEMSVPNTASFHVRQADAFGKWIASFLSKVVPVAIPELFYTQGNI